MTDILNLYGQYYEGWDMKVAGNWQSRFKGENLKIIRQHRTKWNAFGANDKKIGSKATLWETIRHVEGIPL